MNKLVLLFVMTLILSACQKKKEDAAPTVTSPFPSASVTCGGSSCLSQ